VKPAVVGWDDDHDPEKKITVSGIVVGFDTVPDAEAFNARRSPGQVAHAVERRRWTRDAKFWVWVETGLVSHLSQKKAPLPELSLDESGALLLTFDEMEKGKITDAEVANLKGAGRRKTTTSWRVTLMTNATTDELREIEEQVDRNPPDDDPYATPGLDNLVFVPAGDFVMGWDDVSDTEAEHYGARPEHTHPVPRGFFIGRHETTWREYRAFCRAAGRPEPDAPAFAVQENHPVVNVSWNDAKAFCEWAGLRLPGEAEWEKAARGTNGRPYPWGDDDPENELLNWSENWLGRTTPVGTYPRGVSPYGAFDMAGNVSEWCDDWFDARASERYARGDTTPPASGSEKVVKGGSFGVNSPQSWRRIGFSSSSTLYDRGFRPAKSLE